MGCFTISFAALVAYLPTFESNLVKWGLFIPFAGASLLLLSSVFAGQPRLKLTKQGFESQMFFLTNRVQWIDIAEMKEYIWREDRILGWNYVQGQVRKSSGFNRNWSGFDESLSNLSTLKFDEFRDLMFSYWEHAKKAQALELSKQATNPRLKTD
jgi:hypothetical protein